MIAPGIATTGGGEQQRPSPGGARDDPQTDGADLPEPRPPRADVRAASAA